MYAMKFLEKISEAPAGIEPTVLWVTHVVNRFGVISYKVVGSIPGGGTEMFCENFIVFIIIISVFHSIGWLAGLLNVIYSGKKNFQT